MSSIKSTALVTGASTGIGAVYAKRLASRGYHLVLVARNINQLETLAIELRSDFGVQVDVLRADLTNAEDLHQVEKRLREDSSIRLLVNNAGTANKGSFIDADPDLMENLIDLNVLAVTRLTAAALQGMLARGEGDIINIASVVGLAPELPLGVYGATKSFVIALSQAINAELGEKGIYVQAVLPAATRTDIWERAGRDINDVQGVMDVEEMVDAALVGFDRRETVTIPPLHDESLWRTYDAARQALLPHFVEEHAADRYQVK